MRILLAALLMAGAALAQTKRPLPDTAELERELGRFLNVYTIALENAADAPDPAAALYGGFFSAAKAGVQCGLG